MLRPISQFLTIFVIFDSQDWNLLSWTFAARFISALEEVRRITVMMFLSDTKLVGTV